MDAILFGFNKEKKPGLISTMTPALFNVVFMKAQLAQEMNPDWNMFELWVSSKTHKVTPIVQVLDANGANYYEIDQGQFVNAFSSIPNSEIQINFDHINRKIKNCLDIHVDMTIDYLETNNLGYIEANIKGLAQIAQMIIFRNPHLIGLYS